VGLSPVGVVGLDLSVLNASFQARTEELLARAQAGIARQGAPQAATSKPPPWRAETSADAADKAVRQTLAGRPLIRQGEAREINSRAGDVDRIFGTYEAVERLRLLAEAASKGSLGANSRRGNELFRAAMAEAGELLNGLQLQKATILPGERLPSAKMDAGVLRKGYDYTTARILNGSPTEPMAGLTGTETFTINVVRYGETRSIAVDLSEIGASPSLDQVVEHLNGKLEAEGLLTRFERVKLGERNDSGVIEGQNYGLQIKGALTEQLSFAAADATPAVFLAGTTGVAGKEQGQLTRLTDLDTATPTPAVTRQVGADKATVKHDAVATGPNGEVYTLGRATGEVDGLRPRGDADLMLSKYDATGQLIWSRFMGAGPEAEGHALAVGADGQVALVGTSPSKLVENATGRGDNTFVTVLNADGRELFTRQQGARGDDSALAVAFDTDGSLLVAGRTAATLVSGQAQGGTDAYLQRLDSSGNAVWTRQFGSSAEDRATAITVGADGEIYVGSNAGAEGRLTRFEADGSAATWTHSLGTARVADVEFADGKLFVAAETAAADFTAGQFTGASGDTDAVALRFSVDGLGASVDWQTRLGGVGGQSAAGLALAGGQVILAGTARESFNGASLTGTRAGFVAALDRDTGSLGMTQTLEGAGRSLSTSGIAVSQTGRSTTLEKLGLPTGALVTGQSAGVMDQLPLRPGDHFFVQVDRKKPVKIAIEDGETLRSMTFKINGALGLSGRAEVARGTKGQRLSITAIGEARITLQAGASGQDALSILRLPSGTVVNREDPTRRSGISDRPAIVDLGFKADADLSTEDQAKSALTMLDTVQRGLRTAYRHAIDDPTIKALQEGNGRPRPSAPPAYMQAQLANLQAGLARLQSGPPAGSGVLI
jgi:hypothetical protein